MTTAAAALHAPTCIPAPFRPATAEEVYYHAIDTASASYQADVALLLALAGRRWDRAMHAAAQRYRTETAPAEMEAAR